jgi:hypothetical protein
MQALEMITFLGLILAGYVTIRKPARPRQSTGPPVRRYRNGRVLPLAILAIIAGVSLLSAVQPTARADVSHQRELWGSNSGVFDKFRAAVPLARVDHVYYDKWGGAETWPATWPDKRPGVCLLINLRPMPGPLFGHVYDRQLRGLFKSAPPCSRVSIWHENANGKAGCLTGSCNPLGYPAILRDPARFRRMQHYMEWLVRGTQVKFGVIGCGPAINAVEWYARGNDWYGTDLYFNTKYYLDRGGRVSRAKVWARMDADNRAFRIASDMKYPKWVIGETNATPDYRRAAWFTYVAQWFDVHDGGRVPWIATFFPRTAKGGLSTPWPPSPAVLRTLRHLTASHQ